MLRPTAARSGALSFALLLGSTVAACGGSDDDGDAPAAGATSTAAAATEDPFCASVQAATSVFGVGAAAMPSSATDALAKLPEASAMLAEAEANAPEDLRDDVAVLSSTFTAAAPAMAELTALAEAARQDPAKQAELQAATARFQTEQLTPVLSDPAFLQAVGNITAYARDHCGTTTG